MYFSFTIKVFNLYKLSGFFHIQSASSLKPQAKEHEVWRVQKRCLHTLSLRCHVFGKGASTVYKACLQFYSSNNGCVHSPFKAGKMQHNVTRTSSISAIWGGRVPNNDSLVIMEALFFFSPLTPQKIVDEGEICGMYWCHQVFLWHWSDSPLLCQREKSEIVNMGEKNPPIQRWWLI